MTQLLGRAPGPIANMAVLTFEAVDGAEPMAPRLPSGRWRTWGRGWSRGQRGPARLPEPGGTRVLQSPHPNPYSGNGWESCDFRLLLFQQAQNEKTPVIVERVVADIDEIVRPVRFPGWQTTAARRPRGEEGSAQEPAQLPLHQDADLFERAYGYIRQHD